MTRSSIKIAPSLLAADFGNLNAEIASVTSADFLHCDVMDGHFVPNLTFGAPVLRKLKTKLKRDYHLMVSQPEKLLADFGAAQADLITIHPEIAGRILRTSRIRRLLRKIKAMGCQSGLAIKPRTTVRSIQQFLPWTDLVLIMTVEPGFGGQNFQMAGVTKIQQLRAAKKDLLIAVDGGINLQTALICREQGADILVAGTAIFGQAPAKRPRIIQQLRGN